MINFLLQVKNTTHNNSISTAWRVQMIQIEWQETVNEVNTHKQRIADIEDTSAPSLINNNKKQQQQ